MDSGSGGNKRQYVIPALNPATIPPGSTILLSGRRKCGKTNALTALLYHMRRYPDGIMFNGSSESGDTLDTCFPESFVFDTWDPVAAAKFYEDKDRLRIARAKRGLPPLPSVFIVDDLSDMKKLIAKDETFNKIMRKGRHRGITFIMIVHDVLDLPNDVREQFDYIFAGKTQKRNMLERLWKHVFGMFPSMNDFTAAYFKATADKGFLVAACNEDADDISKCCFHFHSEDMDNKKFRLGSVAFWSAHEANYDPMWNRNPVVARMAASGAQSGAGKGHKNGPPQITLGRRPGTGVRPGNGSARLCKDSKSCRPNPHRPIPHSRRPSSSSRPSATRSSSSPTSRRESRPRSRPG